MRPAKQSALTVLTLSGIVLFLFLLVLAAFASAEEDTLSYKFDDTGEKEVDYIGPDNIEYIFEGKEDYEMRAELIVKNTGNKDVNFTFYGYDEDNDLLPNPNSAEEKKIDVLFNGRSQLLGAGSTVTLNIPFDITDNLLSLEEEEPYTLSLRLRNDDLLISHTMYVNMTIQPIYELALYDPDNYGKVEIEKKINAGNRLDVALLVRNSGNTLDDVRVVAESDFEGVLVTVTKPSGGLAEDVRPEILDQYYTESIGVKIETASELENGKYYVSIEVSSEYNQDVTASMQFVLEVGSGGNGGTSTQDTGKTEGEMPGWVLPVVILLPVLGIGGGVVYMQMNKDEEDEDWDEDDRGYDQGGWDDDEEAGYAPRRPAARRRAPAPTARRRAPAPAPGPAAAAPAGVKCPGCQAKFKVKNPKRPLRIKCPRCERPITLKGKPGAAGRPAAGGAPAPAPAGPAAVGCPKCRAKFKVKNPKRPLRIKCPKCETPITLKGGGGGAPARKQAGGAQRPAAGAAGAAPKGVKCPGCATKFKVKNPKRPLKVKCPGCAKVLTLK